MKKRILSLVLCAAMLLSMCLFLGAGVTNSLTVCDSSGEAVKRVDLPVNQKISLTAQAQSAAENDAYQWQIRAAKDVWANILGSDTQTLELSYPMVASALSEKNTVQIRCRLTSAETGEATFSDAVTVEVTAATAVDTPASADAAAAPVLRSPAKVAVAANDAPEYGTYTIIINYQFEDGTLAANPWSATVPNGSTYKQDVPSPTVVGYAPDQPVVHVNATKEKTYTVTYQPAEVKFTVEHYKQNVSNDEYTLADTETEKGKTESVVGDRLAKDTKKDTNYSGFYSLLYDTTTKIAADGSTVVKIYYDRYYFLMNFDLDGGYGVEPIYARYGAPINVGDPTKPGYSFKGWNPELPKTMPEVPKDAHPYKATWNTGTTSFTVVYWYENANDNGYSYVADQKIPDVVPGTQVSSDTYKDANFNNKDAKHFTYNASKTETVTVAGDGSTVLNVYFTRNTYTMRLKDEQGYNNYVDVTTISAKYEEDISKYFPVKFDDYPALYNCSSYIRKYKDKGYVCNWLVSTNYSETISRVAFDVMPGSDTEYEVYNFIKNDHNCLYYLETVNGATGAVELDGKQFEWYKTIPITSSGRLTYDEEFFDIVGFTKWKSDPKFDSTSSTPSIQKENKFYYTRNSYNLKFYNYNGYVDSEEASVQYEAPLKSYDFTPAYPAEMEKNAYEFAGWYTTAGCYPGSKVNWDEATMPASDVTLYAKWSPKTHTVKTYLTENDLNGSALGAWMVSHGTAVPENQRPVTPENGNYTFVGWFYKDADGTEHAFDFSMPVNRDLNLYAKWIANKLVPYTIKYAVQNKEGTLTYIADDTKGSALALTTKTFEAKTGTQLKEGYQSSYFPTTSSHSITMDIEGTTDNELNDFTFYYVQKEKVKYTVRYLEKGTNKVLHEEKRDETSAAVITEKFEQINSYAPDAYQKRLVLSADDAQNVITFWYVKDEIHAPVQIIHWTQNIAGDGYTEYQSSTNLNGVIGTEYSETPLTIAGFTYNKKPDHPVAGYPARASGELTAGGLVLNLYYDRITYPYEFRFLDQETGDKLADPVKGEDRYQAQVTETAKTIPGYELVFGGNSQSMVIQIEDSDNVASKNVKTFYYREQTVDIKYVAVGSGTLDTYQEPPLKVLTGEANGSTPKPNDGYKFVGWFEDEACTQKVDKGWVGAGNKLTPTPKQVNGVYEDATYYAKFELDVFDLKITKNVTGKGANLNQTFVFTVKNEANETISTIVLKNGETKTIKGLPVGIYTVTEDTAWSWQYKPTINDQQVTTDNIQNGVAAVTFVNKNKGTNWLTSLAKALNVWKDNGQTVQRDPNN